MAASHLSGYSRHTRLCTARAADPVAMLDAALDASAPPRLALHPQRKRRFFAALAQLLDEAAPEVRPLAGAFFGPELPAGRAAPPSPSAPFVPSHSPLTGDSCESVEFGAPRTRGSFGTSQQSSHNDSMADSLLFLPPGSNSLHSSSSQKRQEQLVRFDFELELKPTGDASAASPPVTTLVNCGIVADKQPTTLRLELVDYFDSDRMCELAPCWLRSDRASCEMHQGPIRRPMLLFCLQALDEFIARSEWQGQQRWRVQACKVARRVFSAMWEADVLGVSPSERDVVLADYVAEKATVVGVALDIWRLIARYWDKYKQNYLHQQELYFTDGPEGDSTLSASKWDQVRALLQIYGMKPSQAMWLVEQRCGDQLDVSKLTDKQFHAAAHGLPSIEQLRVGLAYLRSKAASSSTLDEAPAPVLRRRPMISQQDGKTAFNAILIHLKKWNEDVQVFPCGSFSRGAAFISVLDVLVAVPIIKSDSASPGVETDTKCFQDVVAALTTAKVVQKGSIRQLSGTRGACVIPFKNSSILLDLKVYYPPRSWLALLYFTGPEDFVIAFFTELLQRSLREISDTSFERVYTTVVDVLGHDALLAIESEKDLFDIVDREYLLPTHRI